MDLFLELYKTFYLVAKYGNISAAAQNLYITQPAVTRTIQKLEETLGVTLFSRTSRGVRLTAEGKLLYPYVEKAMQELSKGEELLKKIVQKESGKIIISVSPTLFKHFLIPKLESYIKDYPKIEVNVVSKTSFESLQLLDEEKIDLCIISRPLDCSNFIFIELSEIQDIFVASKSYLASMETSDLLREGTFMFLENGNVTREYIDKHLKDMGFIFPPKIVLGNMDFLIEFAKIGMGISAVIKDFVQQELAEETLVELSMLPALPKRSIGVAYPKNTELSIAAKSFLEHLVKLQK
ncbi:MAG: LysR family transcriptional regulator [Peptococcaceae bacterium]|nr:LysR family transcriptional regulator [Peptococcaceae bacterium]